MNFYSMPRLSCFIARRDMNFFAFPLRSLSTPSIHRFWNLFLAQKLQLKSFSSSGSLMKLFRRFALFFRQSSGEVVVTCHPSRRARWGEVMQDLVFLVSSGTHEMNYTTEIMRLKTISLKNIIIARWQAKNCFHRTQIRRLIPFRFDEASRQRRKKVIFV